MIIKRQFLLTGLAIGLFVTISMPLGAQDRDEAQNLGSNLSQAANEAWNAMQYAHNSMDSGDNPSARQLYWSIRDFNRRAERFAQESREPWEQSYTLRNEARQLVNQASRIDHLMLRADVPDSVRQEWSEVDNSISDVADSYNIPYERERGLARRNWDRDEDR